MTLRTSEGIVLAYFAYLAAWPRSPPRSLPGSAARLGAVCRRRGFGPRPGASRHAGTGRGSPRLAAARVPAPRLLAPGAARHGPPRDGRALAAGLRRSGDRARADGRAGRARAPASSSSCSSWRTCGVTRWFPRAWRVSMSPASAASPITSGRRCWWPPIAPTVRSPGSRHGRPGRSERRPSDRRSGVRLLNLACSTRPAST